MKSLVLAYLRLWKPGSLVLAGVSNTMLPGVVAWLLPTIIGSALITQWHLKLKKKGI